MKKQNHIIFGLIILLAIYSGTAAFGISNKIQTDELHKLHKVTFEISSNYKIKSGTLSIHQFNAKAGFNKIITIEDKKMISVDLMAGSYNIIVNAKILTNGGPENAVANTIFSLGEKDKTIVLKITPLDGMA